MSEQSEHKINEAVKELVKLLQADYGCDFSFIICGQGRVLAQSNIQGVKLPEKETAELVVEALRKSGVDASWEYPGFISIRISNGGDWSFGTNNPTWCGDLSDSKGFTDEGVDLEIKSDSQDVEAIREAIINALDAYNQAHGTSYNRC